VSAVEKSTGHEQKITITNDKGRLSKSDIEKMTEDAEKYKKEDELWKERIDAKNTFESLLFQTKSQLSQEEAKTKLGDDYETCMGICDEYVSWLDDDTHTKEDYENKQREFQEKCTAYLSKLQPQAGNEQPDISMPSSDPNIEDVD